MKNKHELQQGDALLIVDAQVDFFPGGALPVPGGDEILPIINEWIEAAESRHIPIFASRDWHPANHCSFHSQGGPWPVHCVQHSHGANIHHTIKLPSTTCFINKADDPNYDSYSAFQGKTLGGLTLDQALKKIGIKRLFVAGLAQDYCVVESALEGRHYGYTVYLISQGTRPISAETGDAAMDRMREAGVIVIT